MDENVPYQIRDKWLLVNGTLQIGHAQIQTIYSAILFIKKSWQRISYNQLYHLEILKGTDEPSNESLNFTKNLESATQWFRLVKYKNYNSWKHLIIQIKPWYCTWSRSLYSKTGSNGHAWSIKNFTWKIISQKCQLFVRGSNNFHTSNGQIEIRHSFYKSNHLSLSQFLLHTTFCSKQFNL